MIVLSASRSYGNPTARLSGPDNADAMSVRAGELSESTQTANSCPFAFGRGSFD